MAHDVFISYSSHDKATADAVCAVMEHRGIRCWIAPRDIHPGQDWATSIVQAINSSKVFLLIFSSFANESGQVKREVERAAHRNLPIIPFRIANVAPNEALEFFISTPHWLDALTPPLHRHAEKLADTVERLIGPVTGWPQDKATTPPGSGAEPQPSPPLHRGASTGVSPSGSTAAGRTYEPFALACAGVCGVLLFAIGYMLLPSGQGFLAPRDDILLAWLVTPLFLAPLCIGLVKFHRMGTWRVVVWIVVATLGHLVASILGMIFRGLLSYDLIDVFKNGAGFAIAGLVGAAISLGSLVLLSRKGRPRGPWSLIAVCVVALGLVSAVAGAMQSGSGDPEHLLRAFMPWQLAFTLAIVFLAPKLYGPSATQDAPLDAPVSVKLGLPAAVAGLVIVALSLANGEAFFKKPDPSLSAAPETVQPAADASLPAADAAAPAAALPATSAAADASATSPPAK